MAGQCCCPVCHPGTDNDPTYAMAQPGVRDASYPHECHPFKDTFKRAFIKQESGRIVMCCSECRCRGDHWPVCRPWCCQVPAPVRTMVHQPLTRHWGDPGPGAREERALSVVTGYTVQIYQNCLLDPYSSTLSDSNSNKAMSILMSGAVPGIMIMFLSPVYLSHVTVTQAQPRQGNPLICSRKKCNP